jgi:hypothetical protein
MSEIDLKERNEGPGYILVDFDRTLATYRSWNSSGNAIGEPIPAMVERVKRWLHMGVDVRIFTARASRNDPAERQAIETWCERHVGKKLPIQNWKDFGCIAIWDDLAITVEANTGWRATIDPCGGDPISHNEEYELLKNLDS